MSLRLFSLALITAAAAALPVSAHAADGPPGSPCRLAPVVPQDDPATYGGVLLGGPYAGTGTLACTVQVGAATHAGADAVAVTGSGNGAVVVLPAEVEVPWTGEPMYVCTAFTPAGGPTVHWTGSAWSLDPGAPCEPYTDPAELCLTATCVTQLDPVICAVLLALRPGTGPVVIAPDGDLYVAGTYVWDCPPYGS